MTDTVDIDEADVNDYYVAKKLVQLKQSADSRSIEFNLSFRTVKKLLSTKKCYYTGKIFGKANLARSIDRVDSSKGYIEGNVVACTVEINQKKTNLTKEDIHLLSKRIKLHEKRNKK
jgi:hypothetical protein